MKIKKMYQGAVPENKILNTYSDSQTDVYSCDYVNKHGGEQSSSREALTAYLPSSQTTTSTDEKVKLALYNQIGTKLSMSNNGVKIGAGISKVKVSGVISFVWDSPETLDVNIKILKNDTPILRINGNKVKNGGDSVSCPPVLIDVQEGDVIYMNVVSNISGNILYMYMNSTFLTVEAVAGIDNSSPSINYSTTEQTIGTWIDGKPLYRKVVSMGALPNSQLKNTPHGISNLGFVTKLTGMALNPTTKSRVTLPYVDPNSQYVVMLFANDTNVVLNSSYDQSGFSESYAIMEYTKTTD